MGTRAKSQLTFGEKFPAGILDRFARPDQSAMKLHREAVEPEHKG
jgi:hypothetical protein